MARQASWGRGGRVSLGRVTLALCLLGGCAGAPDADGGADAGRDAGFDAGRDAGRDSGTDAGWDAGRDAGPRDGGPDDPGWVRLPGLPDECPIERAAYPERLWDVVWDPCTDRAGEVVPGCLTERRGGVTGVIGAWHDDSGTWIETIGGDAAGPGRILTIAPVDGPILAAWHEPQVVIDSDFYCRVTVVAVGGGRAAFAAQLSDRIDGSLSGIWLYLSTPELIGRAETPVWEFPSGFVSGHRSLTRMWLSADLLALQASPDGTLYTFRDGEWQTLTGGTSVPGIPQNVALVGDHTLWEAWRDLDDVVLVHAPWGASSATWRDLSPDDTKGFATDGVDLAWMELHDRQPDGSYTRREVWTAPYRPDLENIEARMVRSLSSRRTRGVVGGGWYASQASVSTVEVVSLRDGSIRTFTAPGGSVTGAPFYASEDEIMFPGVGVDAIRFDPRLVPPDPEP